MRHPPDLELSATLVVTETHSPVCGVLPGSSSHSASAAVAVVVAVSTVESNRLEAEVVVVASWGLSTSPSMSIRPPTPPAEEEEGRADTLWPQMDDRRVP